MLTNVVILPRGPFLIFLYSVRKLAGADWNPSVSLSEIKRHAAEAADLRGEYGRSRKAQPELTTGHSA